MCPLEINIPLHHFFKQFFCFAVTCRLDLFSVAPGAASTQNFDLKPLRLVSHTSQMVSFAASHMGYVHVCVCVRLWACVLFCIVTGAVQHERL